VRLVGEVENAAGAGEDVVVEVFGGAGGLLASGVGGGMEDVGVGFGGEGEGEDVAFEEGDGGVVRYVRGFGAEGCCVAGKDGGACVQGELAIGVEEGFKQPVAEEAGAAGDEDAGVLEGEEGGACVGEDVGEVLRWERLGWEGLGGHASMICCRTSDRLQLASARSCRRAPGFHS